MDDVGARVMGMKIIRYIRQVVVGWIERLELWLDEEEARQDQAGDGYLKRGDS
jgi:hypothetical protein